MSKDREPLDMIHDGADAVSACAVALSSIARALGRVGMSELADEIGQITDDLRRAKQDIIAGHSLSINLTVRRTEESAGNMLARMIAMSETPRA